MEGETIFVGLFLFILIPYVVGVIACSLSEKVRKTATNAGIVWLAGALYIGFFGLLFYLISLVF